MLARLFVLAAALAHSLVFAQEPNSRLLSGPQSAAPEISSIPAYVARGGRTQPIVAVVGENTFTELTDYVVPFGVLSESGVAQVFALGTQGGAIQMFPALRIQPQKTIQEFDKDVPLGADYVIVPAVHKTDDPALIGWISSQAKKGATIVGVCDGVWAVANAGLLAGKNAVGHWYSWGDLVKQFPSTHFIKNRRYVADGQVITTTGVTASMPVSVALVEAIAGRQRAAALAESLGMNGWGPTHRSDDFHLSANHALTAAKNWLSLWAHESVAIPVSPGVDEISLALVADALSRTYRSTAYSLAVSADPIKTKHGLLILPDRTSATPKASDKTITLPAPGLRSTQSLDWALSQITQAYGAETSAFVALQIEYPRP